LVMRGYTAIEDEDAISTYTAAVAAAREGPLLDESADSVVDIPDNIFVTPTPYFPTNPSRQSRRATIAETSANAGTRNTAGSEAQSPLTPQHARRRSRNIISQRQDRLRSDLNQSWPQSKQQREQQKEGRRFRKLSRNRNASLDSSNNSNNTGDNDSKSSTSSFRSHSTLASHRSRLERDRNPYTLGVSVHWLKHGFLEEVRAAGLDETATIYDIENLHSSPGAEQMGVIRTKGKDVTCPIDNQKGAAYVHALGKSKDKVGRATFMLSYVWGYTIGDIIDTLWDYCCQQQGLDPKRTYIWICCLCVNQHRVASNIANGKEIPFRTFRQLFYSRAKAIGNILVMMSPWDQPIYVTRVWCIFEFFTASTLQSDHTTNDNNVTIVMPPNQTQEMARLIVSKDYHVFLDRICQIMDQTKVEDAKASYATDKERIMQIIQSSMGLSEFNAKVNELLRKCLLDTVMRFGNAIADNDDNKISGSEKQHFLTNVSSIISFMEPMNTLHEITPVATRPT